MARTAEDGRVRMRRRVRVAISVAFGLMAVMLAVSHADSVRAEAERERTEMLERYGGEVTTLVVARKAAAAGEVVDESLVEEREWLSALAPEGAVTSIDEVVGKRLTSAVAAGEPLNDVNFASEGGGVEVPEGRVAVSVRLSDRSGLSSDVAAGSRVLAYVAASGGVRPLTSDVVVLSAGTQTGGATASERSVTLAVLPRDVSAVLAAASEGTLRLVLPADGLSGEGADERGEADAESGAATSGGTGESGAAAGETDAAAGSAGGTGAASTSAGDVDGGEGSVIAPTTVLPDTGAAAADGDADDEGAGEQGEMAIGGSAASARGTTTVEGGA